MSDERLEELGLQRRAFLKKATLAGFVAPVVVSFAFEGTAAAHRGSHSFPNQSFPNQGQNDQGQDNNRQGQDNDEQ